VSSAQFRVKFARSAREIFVAADENVLQRGLDEGLDLDYSCQGGTCTTCKVQVLGGSLDQTYALAISDDEKARGAALLCVAKPLSDCELDA
jgi:ferredoxin